MFSGGKKKIKHRKSISEKIGLKKFFLLINRLIIERSLGLPGLGMNVGHSPTFNFKFFSARME